MVSEKLYHACMVFQCLKIVCMYSAFFFNIYRWALFIIAIKSNAFVSNTSFEHKKKVLLISVAVVQTINLIASLVYIVHTAVSNV